MIRAYRTVVSVLLAGGLLVAFRALGADTGVERETYTLKGGIYYVIPDALLRQKGLEFPNVPRDQNAAYDYLAAIEAHGGLCGTRWPYDLCKRAVRDGWPENAQPLVEYLDDKANVLALLRQGAAKPGCHFPFLTRYDGSLEVDDFRLSDLPLPHL